MAMIHSHNAKEEWNQNRFLASGGYWSTGAASTSIHKDGSNSNSLVVGVNNQGQFASTASLKSLQLDASQQPIRRRSHRPRGCRGGRKNRKLKESSVVGSECLSPQSPYLVRHNQIGCDDDALEKQAAVKGDLSPYHHVKVNNVWNFGTQGCNNAPLLANKYSQMLPPPVPSALFECHRQMEESNRMGMKMLPSFDDSDDSAGGSFDVPPPPPSQRYMDPNSTQQWNEKDCEATADTAISSTHSPSASDDSDTSSSTSSNGGFQHHRHIQHKEYAHLNPKKFNLTVGVVPPKVAVQSTALKSTGSSLFVTSPRSFLLGIANASAMRLQNPCTGEGMIGGPMAEKVLTNNSNLQLDPTRNATQKRRW
jgi:hypothetical protein